MTNAHFILRVPVLLIVGLLATTPTATAWGEQGLLPGVPLSLTANVSGTTVTLDWLPPTTSGVAPSYIVEAALSAGGPALATVPVTGTSLTVPDVPIGTFFVRVRAINADGQSNPSNEVVVSVPAGGCTMAPAAPATLTSTVNGSLITLNWTAPSAGCSPTHYVLQAGSAAGLSNIAIANTGLQTAISASAPPETYFVRVIAVNAFGSSAPSNEVQVTVGGGCTAPPNAPQGLIRSISGPQLSLSWNAAVGGCTPTSYVVQAGRFAGTTDVASFNVGVQTSLTATAPAGTFFLRVVALNAFGPSTTSNEVTFTVAAPPPPPPLPPPPPPPTRYRVGAVCRDGTRSSATGSGACSWHGGVACWLYSDGSCTNP